jgi:hypothetical protein
MLRQARLSSAAMALRHERCCWNAAQKKPGGAAAPPGMIFNDARF